MPKKTKKKAIKEPKQAPAPAETEEVTENPIKQINKEQEKDKKTSYLKEESPLAMQIKQLSQQDYSSLVEQVETEYKAAYDFMNPKIEEWGLRLKLYNNQKRDKSAVGDNLMFTVHQTVLASLYSDRLTSEFEGKDGEGDEEVAETLNALAIYDEDDMEKDIIDYEWDWDASFFGRGLLLFWEFDRETKTPLPEVIDPMTWLRDPKAKSVNGDRRGRGAMRYGGREIRLTKYEMEDAQIYFNIDKLNDDQKDSRSMYDRNVELRAEAQGLGTVPNKSLVGENKDFRLLEWFTIWKGKKCLVTMGNNRTQVVRFTEIKEKKWPIIDRVIYPIAHDWDSVSIPDLTEDKQRARAVMANLSIKGAKVGLHPMYLFDTNKVTNKADLNFEFNKFVGVNGPPQNAVVPMYAQGVKSEVQWILEMLDMAAQRSTATPEMQQGVQSAEKRTASEVNLIASKVDTRYSLSAKIFGWSEKRFWKQWYALYKKHFKEGIDEKSVRISGAMGSKWRKLTRENIVLNTDPDVRVESKILSEDRRLQKLQMFRAWVKDVLAVAGQQANLRFALKRLGRLSGLTKDEIDRILPPTIDEMQAEEENEILNEDELVDVNPSDDDMLHMEIHNKSSETPAKYAHVRAHKRAMKLKKERPELFPKKETFDPNVAKGLMEQMQGIGGPIQQPNQQQQVPQPQ